MAAAGDLLEVPASMYASVLVDWSRERHLLKPGRTLGPYTIQKHLARGGTANVYLAHDPKHHRVVALKVLHSELAVEVGQERFLREVNVTAGFNHPHILPLFDSGSADGLLFYVMPYVEGESLRDRLIREHPLPIPEALAIARDIAAALEYAHRRGVVHRDIKPENVLLNDGHAIVVDFGIALLLDLTVDRLTGPGAGIGTPCYMSPEQATGAKEIGPPSDIYGLGCVLYEMLSGDPPFTGRTAQQVIARHASDPVPPLRTVRPEVSPGLEAAIFRALAKAPAARYATVEEFARSLS